MDALKGKVAIVTGATSGIGERIAELFAEEGAKVVAAGRREAEGAALEKRLGVSFVRADVSHEADVKAMIDHTIARFGRVDCLVNNAGIPFPMISIVDIDVEGFDRVQAINVRGVMLGMKHVAPTMLAQGGGSIINIASMVGSRGGLSGHPYFASKGAVIALSRSVAAELGEKGIRVNSISPGAIVTGIFGKVAGVEGGPGGACGLGSVRQIAADTARRYDRRYSQSRSISGQRRIELRQWSGSGDRWRPHRHRRARLVRRGRRPRGYHQGHQGGGGFFVEIARCRAATASKLSCISFTLPLLGAEAALSPWPRR
jgi:NAD(P)-dependent dehydrogenase (short-subunit alcohol dehydrogenase family)